ncbi:golgin subfamily A member 6-like protein 22 [Polyergus mexicanus]|uniref:golgin subfamily A member 6-like protein 22 n=1 Tax=Polyergus mexicanus TaxID=615972 RepID=UPI0038B4F8EE
MGERKEEDREGWERQLREELRKDIITGVKLLGEEIREDLREIKDSLVGQGEGIKKELEKIREEFREREREWEEERREMRGRIENLEKKLEKWIKEGKGRVGEEGKEGAGVVGEGELETKIKVIERKLERKEREDRKRNIVIRRVEVEKGDVRGGVEKILEILGVNIKIESVKRVGITTEGERGMAVVTLGSMEQKRQVMENKKKLRGREERIEDDLTWEERKVRWRLREIARKEEGEGRRVRIGNGGLQIDGKWWKWNEEEEVLKSERGELKGERVGIGEWDVIVLMETWVVEKGWRGVKNKLQKGFKWGVQYASRKNKKGRAMGGMIMGIRREREMEIGEIETMEEGMMTGTLKIGGEEWRIVGVYVNEDLERKIEGLKKWMEEREEEGRRIIIGGDFNARTGEMGGRVNLGEEEEIGKNRNSKDKKSNREGRRLVEMLEETGWSIVNGNIKGDEKGEKIRDRRGHRLGSPPDDLLDKRGRQLEEEKEREAERQERGLE